MGALTKMSKISQEKEARIKEEILSLLFHSSPHALYTVFISKDIVRDEEFVKRLLLELEKAGLVTAVRKSPKGKDYSRRLRWRLTERAYQAYKEVGVRKL